MFPHSYPYLTKYGCRLYIQLIRIKIQVLILGLSISTSTNKKADMDMVCIIGSVTLFTSYDSFMSLMNLCHDYSICIALIGKVENLFFFSSFLDDRANPCLVIKITLHCSKNISKERYLCIGGFTAQQIACFSVCMLGVYWKVVSSVMD